MNKIDLDQRKLLLQEKLDKMKYSELLPNYPANQTSVKREKKRQLVRKIVFDSK